MPYKLDIYYIEIPINVKFRNPKPLHLIFFRLLCAKNCYFNNSDRNIY